jgi:DNA-binding transcriptional LysR family regulator
MSSVSLSQYLRWPHLSIDISQPWVDQALEARNTARRVAVVMPYHVLGSSILPGTDLVLTVPARLVSHFADSSRTHVLDAPRELGDVQFYAVWHPRVDEDPSHRWLRRIVRAVASPPTTRRRRASKNTSQT